MYIPAIGKFSPLTFPEVFSKVTRPSLTLVSKVVTRVKGTIGFFFFWGGGGRDLIFPFILFKIACVQTPPSPQKILIEGKGAANFFTILE